MDSLQNRGYLGNPQQMYTLRRVRLQEGRSKGSDIIEVCTANGLQVDILPDSGLDIGQTRYCGINVSFLSKNGYDSPLRFSSHGTEFLNTFPGGLLYTCGLRSTGGAHQDGNEWHPLHGRYHSLSAEQISTTVTDNVITVIGTMRETALFGHCLELKRTISIPVFGSEINISDQITNLTPSREEFALLYHCNYGYPFISEAAYVELPENRKTTPRTPFAATGIGRETTFDPPIPGEEERVFFHEEMEHCAAIVNSAVGIKLAMSWSDNLPILAHWRSMASGDYVCGLEPTNCYIMGRKFERENGTLPTLGPFETINTHINISFARL